MDGYFLYIANRLDKIRHGEGMGKSDILHELKSWDLWRAVTAEFVATMLFVFIGTMSAVSGTPSDAFFVKVAFTFGIMIAVCIQMFGHVSGGHMNPAVSIAMMVAMNISPLRGVLYVVAQCCGGMLGSLLLKGVTPDSAHSNLGLTMVSSQITAAQGFGCETIFTFILVMSIFGCTDPNRPMFGSPALGIGLTVTVAHLAGIPFTGASMNPARSLASAVVSDSFEHHWVYWVGPIFGGVIAALLYKFIFDPYRGSMTYDEATNKMMASDDMIVVPKSYHDAKTNGKTNSGLNKMDQQSSMHL